MFSYCGLHLTEFSGKPRGKGILSEWNLVALPGTSVQFSLVAQSCLTLSHPMDCSTPGFLVYHQLLELAQTRVHQVCDAIQLSSSVVPFSSCLQPFPASGSFPLNQFFTIRWPKYWSFSFSINPCIEYSGLISFRIDSLISLQSKGLSRVFFNTTVQKHQFFDTKLSL